MESANIYEKVSTRSKFLWQIIKNLLFIIFPIIGAIIAFYTIILFGVFNLLENFDKCFHGEIGCHGFWVDVAVFFKISSFLALFVSVIVIIYFVYKNIALRFSFLFGEKKIFNIFRLFPIAYGTIIGGMYFFTNILNEMSRKTGGGYYETRMYGEEFALAGIILLIYVTLILVAIGLIFQKNPNN